MIQTVPGAQGLSATIKLVNRATFIKDFATLGLELEDRVRLVEEVRSGLGLILVTSPAYDGASTTCYSIMSFLAQGQRDVLSIESPIQWAMDGVRQVEAETAANGPKMEETLRAMAAVRPDVLMLSAIPDYATLLLAAQLASSRLVIARATSATAARGLVALRDMGVPPQLLAGSLGLVLGQRLIRTLCRICRTEAEPPPAQTLEAHGIDRDEAQGLVFFKGKGCPTCNTIGYRGRRAIFEAHPGEPGGALGARARPTRRRGRGRRRRERHDHDPRARARPGQVGRHELRRVRETEAIGGPGGTKSPRTRKVGNSPGRSVHSIQRT